MNKTVEDATKSRLNELSRGLTQGLIEDWGRNVPEEYANAVAEYVELMDLITGGLWSVQFESDLAHKEQEVLA